MAVSRQSGYEAAAVAVACEDQSELLEAVLESVAGAVVVVDAAGRPVFSHPQAAPLLRADCLYLPDMTTSYPAGSLPLARALRGEVVERAPIFAREAGAQAGLWLLVSAKPVRDWSGEVKGAVAVVHQHTTSGQVRDCCRNGECLRALIENGLDIISVLDTTGIIAYLSPSVKTVLAYNPKELIGRSAFDLVHPEDLRAVLAAFEAALADPLAGVRVEFRYRHRDGSWRYLEGMAKRLPGGAFSDGVVVNARDVSERRRCEERIRFQASLLDQVRNAVIAIDAGGGIIYWNQFAEQLYQWKREEVLGKRTQDVTFPPAGKADFEAALRQTCECGYYEGELLKQRKDGTTFPASVTASAIKDERGAIIGFVAITVDVTERKSTEARLRESGEQLRTLAARLQAVRERERSIIAHDIHDHLSQSLAAMNIGLAEVRNEVSRAASPVAVVSRLTEVSALVQRTIESLQKLSGELRPSLLDILGLGAAVERCAREFEEGTGLRCRLVGAGKHVCASPDVSIAVYRILQEALNNIARHARATEVRIRLRKRGRRLLLEVSDNGRGISEQEIAASASLGLLEMRERARLVGGEISLRGSPGEGTTVCVKVRDADRQGHDGAAGQQEPAVLCSENCSQRSPGT